MNRMMRIFCLGVVLLFSGCVSLVEKTGQVLDGSAFEEKTIAVYRGADMEIAEVRDRDGEASVIIMLDRFPTLKLRGTLPDAQGEFHLVSLDYLGSSHHGWNEFRLDLFGSGRLDLGEFTARLSLPDTIEPIAISWGRIRRYDTRITGDEALTNLRNRYERILALAEWMKSQTNAPSALSQSDFERYWKPILFPETIQRRKRPHGWLQENDRWTKAEDILWNTSYTERVFPELLWEVRNSGTMLRDWEEALYWIYNEYQWERVLEHLSNAMVLSRTK